MSLEFNRIDYRFQPFLFKQKLNFQTYPQVLSFIEIYRNYREIKKKRWAHNGIPSPASDLSKLFGGLASISCMMQLKLVESQFLLGLFLFFLPVILREQRIPYYANGRGFDDL